MSCNRKKLLFIPLLAVIIPSLGYAQATPTSLEIKMNVIFQDYNSDGPGCAVAIISNGKTIFNKGYGRANIENDVPISSTTVFDIASVAKQFTGLAIATLIEEGKIAVDDDIRKYLPQVPDFGKTITIAHLLHHTSGIRDWSEALPIAGWKDDDVCSFANIMRFVQQQKDLDFEPGTRFSYSNTGYNLLAAVVAQVSGKTFAQWCDEYIFKPVGMTSSQIRESHTALIQNLAESYVLNENKTAKTPNLLTADGSSSLFSTLDDMVRWTLNLEEQVKLKNPIYSRMLQTGRLNNGDAVDYGFGLNLSKEGSPKKISHSGFWAGFRSVIVHYPEQQLSIIILANTANLIPRIYAEKIADVLLQRNATLSADVPSHKKLPAFKAATKLEEKYIGTYQLGSNWYITITKEQDKLMSRTNGEIPYSMVAQSDTSYWVDAYNNAITFVKAKDQYALKFGKVTAERITPLILNTEQLNRYTGNYYSKELETTYSITAVDSKLIAHHFRLGDHQIYPDPVMDAFGSALGSFRFIRNSNKQITGFTISGSRVKNIQFLKLSCK